MKLLVTLGLVVIAGGAIVALGLSSSPDAAEDTARLTTTATPAVTSTPPAGEIRTFAGTEQLVRSMASAYQAAPAMTDRIDLVVKPAAGSTSRASERKLTLEARLDGGGDASVQWLDHTVTADDGSLYLTYDNISHKYVQTPIGGDIGTAYRKVRGRRALPLHVGLRNGVDTAALAPALSFEQLRNPRLESQEMVTDSTGGAWYELRLAGDNGGGTVRVDAATRLIQGIDLTYVSARSNAEWMMTAVFNPAVVDELDEPVDFNAGGRFAVTSEQALRKAMPGQPAPDFTLEDLDGNTVTLSELRGNVVILDFWATWCGPCRRGLPLLDQFHRWAEDSGQPIHVFAVDVWEKHPTPEAKKQAVQSFWDRSGYKVPTLLDLNSTAVRPYGFNSIPTTIIVAPDGSIANVHTGFKSNMVAMLKAESLKLLE